MQASKVLLSFATGAGSSSSLSPPTVCLSACTGAAEFALATDVPLAACAAAEDGITMLLSLRLSGTSAVASAGLLEAADVLLEAPLPVWLDFVIDATLDCGADFAG